MPLDKVADAPFHIQRDEIISTDVRLCKLLSSLPCGCHKEQMILKTKNYLVPFVIGCVACNILEMSE